MDEAAREVDEGLQRGGRSCRRGGRARPDGLRSRLRPLRAPSRRGRHLGHRDPGNADVRLGALHFLDAAIRLPPPPDARGVRHPSDAAAGVRVHQHLCVRRRPRLRAARHPTSSRPER